MILTVACCQRWWSELSNQCLTPCCLSKVKDPSRVLLHLRDWSDCAQTSAELSYMLPSADLCSTVCWSLKCHSCSEKSYFQLLMGTQVFCVSVVMEFCFLTRAHFQFRSSQFNLEWFYLFKYHLTGTNTPCYWCMLQFCCALWMIFVDFCSLTGSTILFNFCLMSYSALFCKCHETTHLWSP